MRDEPTRWMPLRGDYRSGPVRPRWDGPGWGSVVLAGAVVAAMGWAVFADGAEKELSGTAGAGAGAREAAVVIGAEPRARVPVSWERKTGEKADVDEKADAAEKPRIREAVRTRPVESAVERTKAVPEERERRPAKPVRRAGPERTAKPERAVEHTRYAKKAERRRADVRPFERGRAEPRGAVKPLENPLSGFAGRECERQMAGAGPFCSTVLDRIFADGQAHGGR